MAAGADPARRPARVLAGRPRRARAPASARARRRHLRRRGVGRGRPPTGSRRCASAGCRRCPGSRRSRSSSCIACVTGGRPAGPLALLARDRRSSSSPRPPSACTGCPRTARRRQRWTPASSPRRARRARVPRALLGDRGRRARRCRGRSSTSSPSASPSTPPTAAGSTGPSSTIRPGGFGTPSVAVEVGDARAVPARGRAARLRRGRAGRARLAARGADLSAAATDGARGRSRPRRRWSCSSWSSASSAHSLGLISEAAHSGTDLVAALLTFLALGVAGRPADLSHQYGHGKAEHLAALAEASFLSLASVLIGARAIDRLIHLAPLGRAHGTRTSSSRS